MLKRLTIALLVLFFPLSALADDSGTASSAGLGPQSTTPNSGSSSADSAALQPAGLAPLQSSQTGNAGLTAPSDSLLQAPATGNGDLQVLSTEADGSPVTPTDDGPNPLIWVVVGLVLFAVGGAGVIYRDRRRFRH